MGIKSIMPQASARGSKNFSKKVDNYQNRLENAISRVNINVNSLMPKRDSREVFTSTNHQPDLDKNGKLQGKHRRGKYNGRGSFDRDSQCLRRTGSQKSEFNSSRVRKGSSVCQGEWQSQRDLI